MDKELVITGEKNVIGDGARERLFAKKQEIERRHAELWKQKEKEERAKLLQEIEVTHTVLLERFSDDYFCGEVSFDSLSKEDKQVLDGMYLSRCRKYVWGNAMSIMAATGAATWATIFVSGWWFFGLIASAVWLVGWLSEDNNKNDKPDIDRRFKFLRARGILEKNKNKERAK